MYASPNNFTIEYSDDGEVFTEIEKTDPIYNIRFYLNSSYYIKFSTHPYYRITVPFNATVPIRGLFYGLVLNGWNYYIDRCLIEELQGEVWNIIADEQQNNYTKGYYAVEFRSHNLFSQIDSSNYCQSLRVTLKGRHANNNNPSYGVTGIALLSNYHRALSGIRNYFRPVNGILSSPFSLDSQETLNYDINNIKPTQTGTVKKTSSWIWQYLVQSVNWLRDNPHFNKLVVKDSRDEDVSLLATAGKTFEVHFKNKTAINGTNFNSPTYAGLIKFAPYSDKSGGYYHCIGFDNKDIWLRHGIPYSSTETPTQWQDWFKILSEKNWTEFITSESLNVVSKRSHEHIYLNCDWLFIGTSVTGAIILKTPFQNIGDVDNSMTYIELSVISHKAPTRVAKYIFYLYKWKPDVSNYEQKYYSVLGPQIFSNIYIGALQDNSTVIVLGDFTDTYSNFTVSIDRIVTSFKRTSDDTDKFSLYVESDESVLQYKAKFNLQSAFAKGYVIPDGTATQFLKADGSVDEKEYIDTSFYNHGRIEAGQNLDDFYKDGVYWVLSDAINNPTQQPGMLRVLPYISPDGSQRTNYEAQLFYNTFENGYDVYYRYKTYISGGWQPWIKLPTKVDDVLSDTSKNPVQNKVVTQKINSHTHNGTDSQKIDYNNLENKPTIYTSATINGTSVNFSAQNNNIPAYISYNNILYPFRFTGSAFQIYRNEVWVDLVNFDNFISNDRGIITESNMEDWYRPGINEYFIDESAAVNFLTLKKPLAPPEKWINITINTGTLTNKITGLKSTVLLDNIRTNIKNVFGEEPYTLYTEYDISAMLDSGFGYKLVLKLEKGTAESNSVIVECYKVW